MSDSDVTPIKKQTGFELVLDELKLVRGTLKDIANDVLELRSIENRVGKLETRMTKHEIAAHMMPLVFSSLALAATLWMALHSVK